jgi:peptidoglycan/xylan/chitin deacetylase (PgdA/CDA1 family)
MHRFFIKTPWIVRKYFPEYIWHLPSKENEVYLTFDDGPHPVITPWVLNLLHQHGAKATFFCIGNNVEQYPDVYERILREGHSAGNHTWDHPNGWETGTESYLDNVARAKPYIHSTLFRPPYGKIRSAQARGLKMVLGPGAKVIMWDVLSADFDPAFKKEICLRNVIKHTRPGSIIVFHDSEKAFPNLEYALPVVLEEFRKRRYQMKRLEC